jgi:DNA modification methylase
MSFKIIPGDCLEVLKTLPAESVHTCVTSPPYWGLRDYGTAQWEGGDAECDHIQTLNLKRDTNGGMLPAGQGTRGTQSSTASSVIRYRDICGKCGATRIDRQIGLERTPEEFVSKMVEVFREVRRVLRNDGQLWLNLGDSYAGSWGNQGRKEERGTQRPINGPMIQNLEPYPVKQSNTGKIPEGSGLKPKDLVGIPWRVAFALQSDGWYLRSDIIWCLSGGTWVYARTQKGDMPMMVRDMARLKPETVKLWNGEKWTQALGWSRSKRNGDELEIVLRSGERISCTPTHQWPTDRGLLFASELKPGDALESVRIPEPEHPLDTAVVNQEVAWFVGLYIAEGSRSGDTIQIAGHAKEELRWERVSRFAAKWGGSATRDICGNKMSIRVYGKLINALLEQFVTGRTAKDKGLAPVCWRYSNLWLEALIDGYLSGDGAWDEKNQRWRLGFCRNYNLERDLRTLAARIGARLVLNPSTVPYNGKNVPTFRGELRFKTSNHHNCKSPAEIVEIRKARCREVYDIGVEDEPHTYALASGIVTHNCKPNPMPESVTDRPTKSHEYIFLLTKSPRYYYDAEAVKEQSTGDVRAGKSGAYLSGEITGNDREKHGGGQTERGRLNQYCDPASRNKRSVWTVATAPFSGAHFATFPPKLIEPCILAGTSEQGCCSECGAPWERVVERGDLVCVSHTGNTARSRGDANRSPLNRADKQPEPGMAYEIKTLGWKPTCTCYENGSQPCVVLDPFAGAGTTGLVARRLGRSFIGIELNPEYLNMAENRIVDDSPLFNRLPVEPSSLTIPDALRSHQGESTN